MCLKLGRPELGVEDAAEGDVKGAAEIPEPRGSSVGIGVEAPGADGSWGVAVAFPPAQAPTTIEIVSATSAIGRIGPTRILIARLWPTNGRLSSTSRMSLETARPTRPRPLRDRWARPAGRPERPARRGNAPGVASP